MKHCLGDGWGGWWGKKGATEGRQLCTHTEKKYTKYAAQFLSEVTFAKDLKNIFGLDTEK